MKMFSNRLFYLAAFLLFISSIAAPPPLLTLDSYGVWDRSFVPEFHDDPSYDYLRGIRIDLEWSDLQQNQTNFEWSLIQKMLLDAYAINKTVKVSVNVGPDAPEWIYAKGVPKVFTQDDKHEGWGYYPYYLSDNYKRFFFVFIEQFANFLRAQPPAIFRLISFVQVKTGCTGDEVAYKGKNLDNKFFINEQQWSSFRLEAFEKFRVYFNEGDSKTRIPLLFNAVDPDKNEAMFNWLMTRMTFGFGFKGSAFVRGHHLSDELTFKNKWIPYLVNPKGLQLFSGAEMDLTWTKPYYQKNVALGFYWGMLSGLNTGLSVWDVSEGALYEAKRLPILHEIFRFFNRYANQIYPATATAAYSIFHEGLNSANTVKFPEYLFGNRRMDNKNRYLAICQNYSTQGAEMSDLDAAVYGQVWQRDNQEDYNDAGWEIEEGNYERWLTQLNPGNTSIGLFRVRGPINNNSEIYDRFARAFQNSTGKNAMYFKFNEEMFPNDDLVSLKFKITWLDRTQGSTWALKYKNRNNKVITGLNVKGNGDNKWKSVNVTISDALVNKSGFMGSDFTLQNTDAIDDIFHGIEVLITRSK